MKSAGSGGRPVWTIGISYRLENKFDLDNLECGKMSPVAKKGDVWGEQDDDDDSMKY